MWIGARWIPELGAPCTEVSDENIGEESFEGGSACGKNGLELPIKKRRGQN